MKKVLLILLCVVAVLITVVSATVGYAYFSKREIYEGLIGANIELLFDRLDDTTRAYYQTDVLGGQVNDEASWGSEENPYIISNVKHLYNLAELQRLGYFDINYISKNYDESGTYLPENGGIMPYFMVCTPEGKPVTIDGKSFGSNTQITAIGTEEFPFIGSVKGAFAEGSCTVGDGKDSTVSAIYDVMVMGNPANVDAGLFGAIGYLGSETTVNADGFFEGKASEISNLLLCDVTVSVRSSLWNTVTAFIEEHIFSFTPFIADDGTTTDDYDLVPHENHHIGILAGHIAYTKIEYISIYYTDNSVVALDLRDTTAIGGVEANYLSISGVIGFMDNLNPAIGEDGNSIGTGTGQSNKDISHSAVGGGGLLSGDKAGYVIASDIFNKYGFYDVGEGTLDSADGKILIRTAIDKDGQPLCEEWVRDRILWGTENTGRYYFYDGVFTFALSGTADDPSNDSIEPTWGSEQDGSFSIGPTDPAEWVTNYSKGNNAVVAFIKLIESDADLAAAITAGKQIFILNENGEKINLMTLYEQSQTGSGGVEEKYHVGNGTSEYANSLLINSLVQSYNGMTPEQVNTMFQDMNTAYRDVDVLKAAIQGDDPELRVINVGATSTTITLNDLQNQYRITTTKVDGAYQYFLLNQSGKEIGVIVTNKKITDYYDYTADYLAAPTTSAYNGYFYYTTYSGSWGTTYYKIYWVDFQEETITEISDSRTNPAAYIAAASSATWQGEELFAKTINITSKTGSTISRNAVGALINADGNKFCKITTSQNWAGNTTYNLNNNGSAVNAAGMQVSKPIGDGTQSALNYFYRPVGTDQWYYSANDAPVTLSASPTATSAGGRDIYTGTAEDGTAYTGVRLIAYPLYTFSNGNKNYNAAQSYDTYANYMSMAQLSYQGLFSYGSFYPLWNGTKAGVTTAANFEHAFTLGVELTPTVVSTTQNAVLKFNENGTCYISYTIGAVTRYLCDIGTGFGTASSNIDESTQLYIYTVEGTQVLDYGRITFEPKDIVTAENATADKPQNTFSVATHVLFANKDEGAREANGAYSVIPLESLGWINYNGEPLSEVDVNKKFRLTDGITFGATVNLFNGSLGTGGFLRAPVGSNGIEANIPQSCVAFRINKAGEQHIRVIVAIPTSEYCPGETSFDTDFLTYNHYFNMWKLEEAGESTLQTFNAYEYADRFAMPNSYPYDPGTTPAEGRYTTVNQGTVDPTTGKVTPGTEDYYCSLNGDRILIAYEFTVSEVGIYVLGASGYSPMLDDNDNPNDSDTGYSEHGVPMEIVYFSADGVASAGRDGQGGSQLGTIDFVYEYNNKVVTVSDVYRTVDGVVTGENGESVTVTYEDYNTYYPSFVIPYFDNQLSGNGTNGYVAVNDEVVRIRRYVADTANEAGVKSTIDFTVGSVEDTQSTEQDQYVKISGYTRVYDILVKRYEAISDS